MYNFTCTLPFCLMMALYKCAETCSVINFNMFYVGDRGNTVVKVLCYNLECRWFDSTLCHWNFSLT